ncbi:hypothetical protein CRE_06401 [Caenorhabditis remanei]|uniref:Uncharacterized protein n=1 Tax=Caenorhabditis remanei TaxID=31234 RepID=E3M1Z6_CAERE|nr:hypothetical protein CRE_06401 [Caenorhabditis remanei]
MENSDEEEDGKDVDDQEMAESLGGQKLAALSKKAQTKRERRQDNEKNVEATGTKFNFKDIRKRRNNEEMEGEPGKMKKSFEYPKYWFVFFSDGGLVYAQFGKVLNSLFKKKR